MKAIIVLGLIREDSPAWYGLDARTVPGHGQLPGPPSSGGAGPVKDLNLAKSLSLDQRITSLCEGRRSCLAHSGTSSREVRFSLSGHLPY